MAERRIFVYGTLMRGGPAHGLLSGARFVRAARTEPAFELADLGPYPGLVGSGRTPVAGEVFEVSEALLPRLDDYEGPAYERRPIPLEDGARAEAWVLRDEHAEGWPRVPSGAWDPRAPEG